MPLPAEQALVQAHKVGQGTSEILGFPVVDQQSNRVKQYQQLEFKPIKETSYILFSSSFGLLSYEYIGRNLVLVCQQLAQYLKGT